MSERESLEYGLKSPIYPHRDVVFAGECGRKPLRDIATWVKGGTFHSYGVRWSDRAPTVEEAIKRAHEYPAVLEYKGKLNYGGYVDFSVRFQQAGDPDSWGYSGPHFTPEDAAYAALTLIEEHEREMYEQNLVIGVA